MCPIYNIPDTQNHSGDHVSVDYEIRNVDVIAIKSSRPRKRTIRARTAHNLGVNSRKHTKSVSDYCQF